MAHINPSAPTTMNSHDILRHLSVTLGSVYTNHTAASSAPLLSMCPASGKPLTLQQLV